MVIPNNLKFEKIFVFTKQEHCFNPLIPGGKKGSCHTYINLELKTSDMFRDVQSFDTTRHYH